MEVLIHAKSTSAATWCGAAGLKTDQWTMTTCLLCLDAGIRSGDLGAAARRPVLCPRVYTAADIGTVDAGFKRDGLACCHSIGGGPLKIGCTLQRGHAGSHVAHFVDGVIVHVWEAAAGNFIPYGYPGAAVAGKGTEIGQAKTVALPGLSLPIVDRAFRFFAGLRLDYHPTDVRREYETVMRELKAEIRKARGDK